MKKKKLLFYAFFSLTFFLSAAQCPPADSISIKIIYQRLSNISSAPGKLLFLEKYNGYFKNCHLPNDSVYAWLLWQIGMAYSDVGKYAESASFGLSAIRLNKLVNGNTRNEFILDQYYWLSMMYAALNNDVEKKKSIDSCIAEGERLNYPYNPSLIRCLYERAQYFYDIGDYEFCVNDAAICERIASGYAKLIRDPAYVLFGKRAAEAGLGWHINGLLRLKKFDEAEKLLAKKAAEYKSEKSLNSLAVTYSQLAEVSLKKVNYLQALADYNRSLSVHRQNKDFFNCRQIMNTIGEQIYVRQFKDYDRAIKCFREALVFKNNMAFFIRSDSIEVLSIYGRMANAFAKKGLFDSAAVYFQLAFNQIRKGASMDHILHSTQEEFTGLKKNRLSHRVFHQLW